MRSRPSFRCRQSAPTYRGAAGTPAELWPLGGEGRDPRRWRSSSTHLSHHSLPEKSLTTTLCWATTDNRKEAQSDITKADETSDWPLCNALVIGDLVSAEAFGPKLKLATPPSKEWAALDSEAATIQAEISAAEDRASEQREAPERFEISLSHPRVRSQHHLRRAAWTTAASSSD